MILSCQNISKSFGTDEILNSISFHIEDQEKAAIVGVNGAGKSTLLKILIGELAPDEGQTIISKGKTLGYLSQLAEEISSYTIYDALLEVKKDLLDIYRRMKNMELEMKHLNGEALDAMLEAYARLTHAYEDANGYALHSEITGVLIGLGFSEEDFLKPVHTLSGGQKTRVSLGKLLLSKPDIILLDEPTNHLDMDSIRWLETFLRGYQGAVLIVSHDRYFLDRIVTRVIEIEHHRGQVFTGNYSTYAAKKAALRETEMKAWLNQQKEIKHQEDVITKLRSFNREKSIRRAESREKLLNKIDRLDKPLEETSPMHLHLTPAILSGNDVLITEGLSKTYGPLELFKNIDLLIRRGEHVALIGNNGTGKSTFLKIIQQMLPADSGKITLGSKVFVGYYDQEHQQLSLDNTVFDEIADAYPTLDNTRIRTVLAAFLFTNDDVRKRISDLSGGERGRVALAKLMLSDANFLILDEPTNHLDIVSREVLENVLKNYSGTLLYVSHDRYFVNATADRILELHDQAIDSYLGNYDYFLEKKEEAKTTASDELILIPAESVSASKLDYQRKKEEAAKERKRQNDLAKTEKRIEEVETRLNELDELLVLEEVYTDVARLIPINEEKSRLDEELLILMETWEELEKAPN